MNPKLFMTIVVLAIVGFGLLFYAPFWPFTAMRGQTA